MLENPRLWSHSLGLHGDNSLGVLYPIPNTLIEPIFRPSLFLPQAGR